MKRTHSPKRRDAFGALANAEQADYDDGRYYGLYEARVTDNKDPEGLGRIKVNVYWQEEGGEPQETGWITRKTFFRGPTRLSRGRKFADEWPIPEVGSVVYIHAVAGNPHNCVWDGMPSFQEGEWGTPELERDEHTDWSMRFALQNGFEFGVSTEGDVFMVVPGNLRIKVQGSAHVSARGVITIIAAKVRNVALTVLRLIGVTIDKTNYPRPDEAGELREMMKDAMDGPAGRQDPGIRKIPDLDQ